MLFQAAFERALEAIIIIRANGIVLEFNRAAEQLFRYQREDVVGRNVSLLMPPRERSEHDGHLARYLSSGESPVIGRAREVFGQRKDGSLFPVEISIVEVVVGEERFFTGTVRDLTETKRQEALLREANTRLEQRVQERTAELQLANKVLEREIDERRSAEERLLHSLQEKEVFLKEIHHRVKNNLQLIISVLNLFDRMTRDPLVLQIVSEIRDRIYAIAYLHETLYRSGELGRVDIPQYLKELVTHLLHSRETDQDLQVIYQLDPIQLTADEALPCGLIVTELVLNSIKHAFPGRSSGRITISVSEETIPGKDSSAIGIVVEDDGVGVPQDVSERRTRSIGIHLIEKLTEKLGGRLKQENRPGARFEVSFLRGGEDQ